MIFYTRIDVLTFMFHGRAVNLFILLLRRCMNPVTNNFGMAGMAQQLPVNFGVPSRSASYFQPVPRPRSASPALSTASQASSASSNSSEGTNKTRAKRVVWNAVETRILIEKWGSKFPKLKGSSVATKKNIWGKILFEFNSACRERSLQNSDKTVEQIKKRINNLEYEYRQIRTKMASTGEEGAMKLKANLAFFDDLDQVLGCRDAVNPDLMPIESTSALPVSPTATCTDDGELTVSPTTVNTSGKEQGAPTTPVGHTSKKNGRKRKNPARDPFGDEAEDPYMKQVCSMWKEAMQKQEERFNRTMELQEQAINSQTAQTKMLVDGLKDMFKEITKK